MTCGIHERPWAWTAPDACSPCWWSMAGSRATARESTLQELAELMQQAGCWDALNLDGGGSTIMLLGAGPDQLQIMNRPCDKSGPRPVPVILGIRRK